MELVCKPPHCPNVIQLLDWIETPTLLILVLERPDPCIELFDYCAHKAMSESKARIILQQVLYAARHCQERGVFHRDIKEENILLNPQSLMVKLIDFGCGDILRDTPYTSLAGNCTSEMSCIDENLVSDHSDDLIGCLSFRHPEFSTTRIFHQA